MKKQTLYIGLIILFSFLYACQRQDKKFEIKTSQIYKERAPYSSFDDEAITFKGALRLSSKEDNFGGISAAYISPEKQVFALSDNGYWIRFKISENHKGMIKTVSNAYLHPMIGENGQPLKGEQADAEGIALLSDQSFAVSFEKTHRILIYNLKKGFKAIPTPGPTPIGFEKLVENSTLESLIAMDDGSLVAAAENARTPSESLPVWHFSELTGIHDQSDIRIRNQKGYSLSGMDRYQDIVFTIFRRYSRELGYKVIIKALPAVGFKFDSPYTLSLNGIEIITIRRGGLSENLEAITILPDKNNSISLYAMSDNNFSPKQENILVKFNINIDKVRKALVASEEDELKEID